MNKIEAQQTGGFPMETDTLDFLQTAYGEFNAFGDLVHSLAIIKGCVITGTQVGNGTVYINGEILPFRGGTASANVIIREETENRQFENGETKIVYKTRYATFGSSVVAQYPWANFHRPMKISEIEKRLVHVGFIQDYYGDVANIPAGWYLCDGENGTPDLRKMFVAGYDPNDSDYNAIGKTGGTAKITPTGSITNADVSVTIPITGFGTTGVAPDGNNGIASGRLVVGSGVNEAGEKLESLRAAGNTQTVNVSHGHNMTINEFDNRPPFYVLAKIMYKG